jgi:hypothetical protein
MGLLTNLALVADDVNTPPSTLTTVAAALSKQVANDFSPIWNVNATVDAFAKLDDVPTDYWPIIIKRDVSGAAGYHEDQNGQPFAVVEFSNDWSLTASHECLEMLADPWGRRLKSGNILDQAVELGVPPQKVRYLVEVCDPSEAGQFAYKVNNVWVSDFYTPHFFDPVASPNVRYSFTGAISIPRTVLQDGYISWENAQGEWFQVRMFADNISDVIPHLVDLSRQTNFNAYRTSSNLRAAIDRATPNPRHQATLQHARASKLAAFYDAVDETCGQRANRLREQIEALRRSQ